MKITIQDTKEKDSIAFYNVTFDDKKLKIKKNITVEEMQYFIDTVVESTFSSGTFSLILKDITRSLMIAKIFVYNDDNEGLEIPDNSDDSMILYHWMDAVNFENVIKNDIAINSILNKIDRAINEQIEFKKQQICHMLSYDTETTEAIKNFSSLINRCSSVLNTIEKAVNKNASKITKYLTPKKMDAFLNAFQENAINYIKQEHIKK